MLLSVVILHLALFTYALCILIVFDATIYLKIFLTQGKEWKQFLQSRYRYRAVLYPKFFNARLIDFGSFLVFGSVIEFGLVYGVLVMNFGGDILTNILRFAIIVSLVGVNILAWRASLQELVGITHVTFRNVGFPSFALTRERRS